MSLLRTECIVAFIFVSCSMMNKLLNLLKVDSLFKRGEEDFCRDLFYLNQCSVLRKADEVCQRGDLSAVLAHLSNAMREDVPSFTLPFKLPGALK